MNWGKIWSFVVLYILPIVIGAIVAYLVDRKYKKMLYGIIALCLTIVLVYVLEFIFVLSLLAGGHC